MCQALEGAAEALQQQADDASPVDNSEADGSALEETTSDARAQTALDLLKQSLEVRSNVDEVVHSGKQSDSDATSGIFATAVPVCSCWLHL